MRKRGEATGARPRLYYGWYVLGITVLGAVIGAGTSQVVMGVLLKPIADDMEWSRTSISASVTAGTLSGALLAPWLGRLTDRYGPRPISSIGAVVVGLALLGAANAALLWQFFIAYVIARAVSANAQGPTVGRTTAVNWFYRMRGRALGMVALGVPLGGAMLALLAQGLIELSGWRLVFLVMAVLTLVVIAVPAALVLRRRPEDMGLYPDGASGPPGQPAGGATGVVTSEPSWTLRQALGTSALWTIIVAEMLGVMGNGALSFHMVAYWTDAGITPALAVGFLSIYALSGAFGSAMWGYLAERFSSRRLAGMAYLMAAALILLLLAVPNVAAALVFAIGFGIMSRGVGTLISTLLAGYYGRRSFGTINGFVLPFQQIGLSLGPLIAALAFEQTGSYTLIFTIFAGQMAAAGGLMLTARRPRVRE